MLEKDVDIFTSDSDSEFDVIPEDTYPAVIDDIELVEQPMYREPSKTENVLMFRFAILDAEDKDLVGRFVWKRMKPTINPGFANGNASNLFTLLKAATKKDPDLTKGYDKDDINELIGKQVKVLVKINTTKKDGRKYNKVADILSLKKEIKVPDSILKMREKMLEKKEEREKENGDNSDKDIDVKNLPI